MFKLLKRFYLVPSEGEDWVMKTIDDSWRAFKCRVKRKHFKKYDNDEERKKNHPDYIPPDIFDELLAYWNNEDVQKMADINVENRQKQVDMHTVGLKSFASIYNELQNSKESKDPPTLAEMYLATRKRKEGRIYKQDEEIRQKIARIEELHLVEGDDSEKADELVLSDLGNDRRGRVRLLGRGVTSRQLKDKGASNPSSLKIPDDCMQAMKQKLKKKSEHSCNLKWKSKQQKMQEKIDNQQRTFNQNLIDVLTHIGQLNLGMNINVEMLNSMFLTAQSPGDASSAPKKHGLSDVNSNESSEHDDDDGEPSRGHNAV